MPALRLTHFLRKATSALTAWRHCLGICLCCLLALNALVDDCCLQILQGPHSADARPTGSPDGDDDMILARGLAKTNAARENDEGSSGSHKSFLEGEFHQLPLPWHCPISARLCSTRLSQGTQLNGIGCPLLC
jgi:hypothetical protein